MNADNWTFWHFHFYYNFYNYYMYKLACWYVFIMLLKFAVICWLFSKLTFSKKAFRKLYISLSVYQSVKQFGSTSGLTFCWSGSGSKLYAKVISIQQKLLLAGNKLMLLWCEYIYWMWHYNLFITTTIIIYYIMAYVDLAAGHTNNFCQQLLVNTDLDPNCPYIMVGFLIFFFPKSHFLKKKKICRRKQHVKS